MKKTYWAVPLITGLMFIPLVFFNTFGVALFLIFPFIFFMWLHRVGADIFIETSSAAKRICFIALENNRQLIPFIVDRIDKDWLKIDDEHFIQRSENDEYIFHGKYVSFASQLDYPANEILNLKSKLSGNILSKRCLLSETFMKLMSFPFVGSILVLFPLFPSAFGYVMFLAGPQFMLYELRKSGALEVAEGQSGNEITIFYIRGSRKLRITKAEVKQGKWWSYKEGLGLVKTTDGSDYFWKGKRIFFSTVGVESTIPFEMMKKSSKFKDMGLRSWDEISKAIELAEKDNHSSLREAQESEDDFIEKVHDKTEVRKHAKR